MPDLPAPAGVPGVQPGRRRFFLEPVTLFVIGVLAAAAFAGLAALLFDPEEVVEVQFDRMDFNDRFRPDVAALSPGQAARTSADPSITIPPDSVFFPTAIPQCIGCPAGANTRLASTLHPIEDRTITGSLPGFPGGGTDLYAKLRQADCFWAPESTRFNLTWEMLGIGVRQKDGSDLRVCTRPNGQPLSIGACSFTDPISRGRFRCQPGDEEIDLTSGDNQMEPWVNFLSNGRSGFRLRKCSTSIFSASNPRNECAPSHAPLTSSCGTTTAHSLCGQRGSNYPFCQTGTCLQDPGAGNTTYYFEVDVPDGEAFPLRRRIFPTVKVVGVDALFGQPLNSRLARAMQPSTMSKIRAARELPDAEHEWVWNVTNPAGNLAGPNDRWTENFSPNLFIDHIRFFVEDATAPEGRRYLYPKSIEVLDLNAIGSNLNNPPVGPICPATLQPDRISREGCGPLGVSTPTYTRGCGGGICNNQYLRWVVRFNKQEGERALDPTALRVDGEVPLIEFNLAPAPVGRPQTTEGFAYLNPLLVDFTPNANPSQHDPLGAELVPVGERRESTLFLTILNPGSSDPVVIERISIVNRSASSDYEQDFSLQVDGAAVGQELDPTRNTFPVRVSFHPRAEGLRRAELTLGLRRGRDYKEFTVNARGQAGSRGLEVWIDGVSMTPTVPWYDSLNALFEFGLPQPPSRSFVYPVSVIGRSELTAKFRLTNPASIATTINQVSFVGPDAAALQVLPAISNQQVLAYTSNEILFDVKFTAVDGSRTYFANIQIETNRGPTTIGLIFRPNYWWWVRRAHQANIQRPVVLRMGP